MVKGKAQYMGALILILWFGGIVSCAANAEESSNSPAHVRSAGCGTIQVGTGNFVSKEIHVLNQGRIFHLFVPNTYDPNHAYPLIFRWHGSGGNGLSGGLGIEYISGNGAIVIGADGLDKSWNDEADADNLMFFDGMLDMIENKYCIDRNRIFSYGFSMGGYFTNLLTCERSDILRASAAIAGGPRGDNCKGTVAAWFLHDSDDLVVPISEGKAARDRVLSLNGCSTSTIDEGEGCVRYQGCDSSPVIWCESQGIGHNIRGDFAPQQVWKFFKDIR